MRQDVLLDTGPLTAALDRRDRYHEWSRRQLEGIAPPLLTCEAVLSEACFLLRNVPGGSRAVMELLRRCHVSLSFSLAAEADAVEKLLVRYADVPMALADACLVRMAECRSGHAVLTLDGDFRLYRLHGRQVVPVIQPDDR